MSLNSKTQQQRKDESIKILKKNNIKVFEGLPVIESYDETKIRNKEEIVKRAIAVCIISVYAEGLCTGETVKNCRKYISNFIKTFNADNFFTPKEKKFLSNEMPTQKESGQFSWKYECLNVLLWALGFVSDLDLPNKICDVPKLVNFFKVNNNYNLIFAVSKLRDKEEILDQADLIYRYNWACTDARINYKRIENIDSGVVYERHYALNWLINYMNQEWDGITTDT